jgi:hypothetical protein
MEAVGEAPVEVYLTIRAMVGQVVLEMGEGEVTVAVSLCLQQISRS